MKSNSKKIIFILLTFCSATFAFSQSKFSDEAEKFLNDFFDLRIALTEKETDSDALKEINSFIEENQSILENFSEEEKLVADNYILMEKYNYLFTNKDNWPLMKKTLTEQKNKNDAFVNGKDSSELNKYTLLSFGNLISCWMVFSISDVMKYGLSVKKYFEEALKIDSSFSTAYLSIAQWYYFCPKIAGGSKETSLSYFEDAVKYAENNCDIFYSNIFLSQLYFEQKKFEQAAELLSSAKKINPESKYIKLIEKLNAEGISIYKYNTKNANVS